MATWPTDGRFDRPAFEPHPDAWGIRHYPVETDDDVWLISKAFREAQEQSRPVAVLIGTEYE